MRQILHFGLGNFARAHLLDYTQDAGGWTVTGVSLRSGRVRDGLAAQGFGYDLCVQGQGVKRIEVLNNVLVAPEDPDAVFGAVGSADLITATVTEKGYHLDAGGQLNLDDPDIKHDLAGQGTRTIIGFLARGLAARRTPVTVICCDNLAENGTKLCAAVMRFAREAGLEIDPNKVFFPCSMVDRITPATTDAVRAISGDAMAVATEPFREWVIEDRFAGPRPDWPEVQFVADVAPHELRKLRMLNGAHSYLAYAGVLAGHEFVHQAIADPVLRHQTQRLMAQAGATLPEDAQTQVASYSHALVERFENPHLHHALRQIAMDGSQKVPQRLIAVLRDDPDADAVAGAIAAWVRFCVEETAQGRALDDPRAAELALAAQTTDPTGAILTLINAADLAPLMPR